MAIIEMSRETVINLLKTRGWIQNSWGSSDGPMCLYEAIRLTMPPLEASIIELIGRHDRGALWNDDINTEFIDIVESLERESIWSITESDLHDLFGPNWNLVYTILRNVPDIVDRCSSRQSKYLYSDINYALQKRCREVESAVGTLSYVFSKLDRLIHPYDLYQKIITSMFDCLKCAVVLDLVNFDERTNNMKIWYEFCYEKTN